MLHSPALSARARAAPRQAPWLRHFRLVQQPGQAQRRRAGPVVRSAQGGAKLAIPHEEQAIRQRDCQTEGACERLCQIEENVL